MSEYKDIPKAESKTDTVLAYSVTINPKEEQEYTIELIYKDTEEDQSEDMGKILSGTLNIQEGTTNSVPLLTAMLRDNPIISERTDFSVTNTATTTGTIYQTNKTEDGSTVYYYSGNTTNNWVKFGKMEQELYKYGISSTSPTDPTSQIVTYYYNTSCPSNAVSCTKFYSVGDDIYWRIIRTNEDESIRLLYAGTSHDTTSGYIKMSEFNNGLYDTKYVGYMYGTSDSLENNRANTFDNKIKSTIDTWYENNLLTNYDKYISKTAIYCNDRSVGSGSFNTGNTAFYYGASARLNINKSPSYKCGANANNGLFETTQALADKFSASTSGGGNGQLTYPIALMTADEVAFAGGKEENELSSPYAWYYTNSQGESITETSNWWLLSPYSWNRYVSSNVYLGTFRSLVFCINGSGDSGNMVQYNINTSGATRPAISLKACVEYSSGNGTPESPYEVTIDDTCASAEN